MVKYEKILKQIPKEELEKFLLENFMQNLSIRSSFEIKFSQYFQEKSKEDFKELLRNSLNQVADRGYISEEMGWEAMHILYDYSDKIGEFVKTNNIKEAIKILEATLEVIGEFAIDGSYGEHEDIQNKFKEVIENILEHSLPNEKNELLTWLNKYIKLEDEFIDFKDEFEEVYNKYYNK